MNNDIKSIVELVDFISEKEDRIQQIEDRQKEIYRESSSRKRSIKNEEQYREYQIWHMEVQEELDELKQEKRNVKRQIQLADDIIKEDLYTAYYAVTGKEEIVADRDVEIPGMEENTEIEKVTATVVELDRKVEVMNPNNIQNEIGRQKEQTDSARKQQTGLEGIGIPEVHNSSDVNVARKSRNPHMQTMLRLVGFGDNAGSGFPTILDVWKSEGWIKPELIEDTNLDQVTLVMKMEKESDDNSAEKSAESAENSADLKNREGMALSERHQQILAIMEAGIEYSTEQVAEKIGLKGPRTRQLLNELVNEELLACIGTTKRRRYIKPVD